MAFDLDPDSGQKLLEDENVVWLTMSKKVLLGLVGVLLMLRLNAAVLAEEDDSISSSGGTFFAKRLELPVPAFAQDDPRWSDDRLGPSTDTLGDEGCAVASAAMVVAFYGIKTDPQQLNAFLTRTGGFTEDGLIHWRGVASIAPARLTLAYNGEATHDLIDSSLLAGNPVIVWMHLPDGGFHFVVIVGKEGQEYLIRNPASSPFRHVYPLSRITDRIGGLCFFRSS